MPIIKFSYQPPIAGVREVGLAGDFSSWAILDLQDNGGVFSLDLHLETGKYRYKFIADGVWLSDPANPLRERDPFGGENSVLIVKSEQARSFTWDEVWQDSELLADRAENYLELNRGSADNFELRFNWYPFLPAKLTALIDGVEHPLFPLGTVANQDVFHCQFKSSAETVKLMIQIETPDRYLYFGASGFSTRPSKLPAHRINLHELPVFDVPDWVARGVIYQIFPDRFCNGDPSLDPDFTEWYYADSREPPPPGQFLPPQREYFHLVPDWNDIRGLSQSPWREEGKPDWWSFYGGDIPGVLSKLDYLQELGITIIYFNPLWQAKSNHKYDAADFRRIDPHFGRLEEMQALVQTAHQKGIRVIVDVAFNHTGESFWAFRDCVEKGASSPYWNWYDWYQWPLPQPLPADFHPRDYYQCWWGIKDMPDLNFDLSRTHPSENYVSDIAKAVPNQPLVDHLLDCVTWWLQDVGIDGFRLDVPDEVPYWFWQLFRQQVKATKPDAWIVGEIWQSARGWVGSSYFDSVMNYAHFKDPVLDYFILSRIDQERFCALIEEGLAQYPGQALGAMMNLLGSHDTWRILELAQGDLHKLRLALLFQMTFLGAPHIYYGDEIGLRGKKDPDNRRPFNWNWEQDQAARELRDYYIRLIKLRAEHSLLQTGEFGFLRAPSGLLAYRRYDAQSSIIVVQNLSETPQIYSPPAIGETLYALGEVSSVEEEYALQPGSAVVFRCSALD